MSLNINYYIKMKTNIKNYNFHFTMRLKYFKFSKSYKYRMIIKAEYRERYHIIK